MDEKAASGEPTLSKFLGKEGSYGKDFGIPADFLAQSIKQVGNYDEIYDRNLGPDTKIFIDRKGTANALQADGGAMISPLWD